MSYSSNIKEKISNIDNECEMCDKMQLEAMILYSGRFLDGKIVLFTENNKVCERLVRLLNKKADRKIEVEYSENTRLYEIKTEDTGIFEDIFANRIFDRGIMEEFSECCIASYVRGAFLAGGSITDPHKSYHLEFESKYQPEADRLKGFLEILGINAKITKRKKRYVVYVKEYETVCDILGLIGDSQAALDIYNISIEKEIRNNINRRINCDCANIDKTSRAYKKHFAAIEKIKKTIGLDKLPEVLQEMARVRIEHPEESLAELGERLENPIGKSGVNHRLNRIVEIAEEIK